MIPRRELFKPLMEIAKNGYITPIFTKTDTTYNVFYDPEKLSLAYSVSHQNKNLFYNLDVCDIKKLGPIYKRIEEIQCYQHVESGCFLDSGYIKFLFNNVSQLHKKLIQYDFNNEIETFIHNLLTQEKFIPININANQGYLELLTSLIKQEIRRQTNESVKKVQTKRFCMLEKKLLVARQAQQIQNLSDQIAQKMDEHHHLVRSLTNLVKGS